MTGMEHVIEQVAERIIAANNVRMSRYPIEPISVQAAREYARALADEGLLAPAPLREEWGSEMHNAQPESSSHVLRARDRDNAQWQVEHNPELATGRIVRRHVTDWLPVDCTEGGDNA